MNQIELNKNNNLELDKKEEKKQKKKSRFEGARFQRELMSYEEIADTRFELNMMVANILYKSSVIAIILMYVLLFLTAMHLVFRDDTRFYASSPDGRIVELTTRETPDGKFFQAVKDDYQTKRPEKTQNADFTVKNTEENKDVQ